MNCCMCCVRPGFTQALNRTEFHSVHQKRTSIKKEGEARAVSDSEGRDTASRFELSHDYEAPRRRYIWYRTLTHVNTQTILYITMCNQERNYLSLSLSPSSLGDGKRRERHTRLLHMLPTPTGGKGTRGGKVAQTDFGADVKSLPKRERRKVRRKGTSQSYTEDG